MVWQRPKSPNPVGRFKCCRCEKKGFAILEKKVFCEPHYNQKKEMLIKNKKEVNEK